jgi:hypothetical protein
MNVRARAAIQVSVAQDAGVDELTSTQDVVPSS